MNQNMSVQIDKPFDEVSALQRQQWVLQVFALTLALTPHVHLYENVLPASRVFFTLTYHSLHVTLTCRSLKA